MSLSDPVSTPLPGDGKLNPLSNSLLPTPPKDNAILMVDGLQHSSIHLQPEKNV